MRIVFALLTLCSLSFYGCGSKEAGPVAKPGDYDAYMTPPGAAQDAAKAAQEAAMKAKSPGN